MPHFTLLRRSLCQLAGFVVLVIGNVFNATAQEPLAPEHLEFFESQIRPLLIENCYSCHNSVNKAEADFALDYRDGIRSRIDLESPDDSMLLQVIRHEIEDLEMPAGGAKLTPEAIAKLARWIRLGAPDPRDAPPTAEQLAQANAWEAVLERRKAWWCFQPIGHPPVPQVKLALAGNHPIDRFIGRELEAADLAFAPEADRATLMRRLSYALTGLPPTPNEVAAFQADTSIGAYETLVDRLLDSEAFGERWARHWMDWLRYAESHGSEGDPAIPHAYRYRDYLIRALNADVPYDQIVREHVAGDLLDTPRLNEQLGINESALATAHWRMVFHGFAPTDALDEKVRFTDDQINVFTKAFLGLTVSCARCHNHKFDAISQADYYALFGILGSTRPSMLDVNSAERQALHREELIELKAEIRDWLAARWLDEVDSVTRQLPQLNDIWTKAIDGAKQVNAPLHGWWRIRHEAKSADDFPRVWQSIEQQWRQLTASITEHRQREYAHRWQLATDDYGTWYRDGNGLGGEPSRAGVFAIAAEGDRIVQDIFPGGAVTHGLSTKHRGILSSPRITLDGEYDLWVLAAGDGGSMVRYAVQNYPRNGTVYPVTSLGGGQWKWHRFPLAYWNGDQIHIELTTAADAPVLASGNGRSWFAAREAMLVRSGEPGPRELAEHQLLLAETAAQNPPESAEELARLYLQALKHSISAWRDEALTDGEALFLSSFVTAGLLPNRLDDLPAITELIEKYRRLEHEVPEPTRIVGLADADSVDQRLFLRGNHKTPGDPVPRRFLEAIDATPYRTTQSGRLELAACLVRADNPLTARVIVNRLWHHLYGTGLVATPDNFGRLGAQPSHPELLDYLAQRLMEHEWSLKDMIRFMVTSHTWRQSSMPSPAAQRVDPENRLLSHANLRRLEAEAIRDSLLLLSGRLDRQMYGESVAGNTPRRSVYVQVRRNSLEPFLRVFDFPEPFSATGRRDVTNVPAQSLTMMNDDFVNSLASSWAASVLNVSGIVSDRKRVDLMYRQALGRAATHDELNAAIDYLADLQGTSGQLVRQLHDLEDRIESQRASINAILGPVRERLRAQAAQSPAKPIDLQPIARWEFDVDCRDSVGEAHGKAVGGARLEAGGLVLDGRSAYVATAPIKQALAAKTLEAWVQLDSLDQRGGGVTSIQTPDGNVFDAIVFGEQSPRQWLAGSNFFQRTKPFSGVVETAAQTEPVHVAIVYHADGTITGYRQGQPYGAPYQSGGPQAFAANATIVTFGLRHLPAGGNRMLAGRILRAQLYDRALTAEEIAASASGSGTHVSHAEVLAALSPEQRDAVAKAEQAIAELESQRKALGPVPPAADSQSLWTDLARALFNFKEFIYLK